MRNHLAERNYKAVAVDYHNPSYLAVRAVEALA
jgi:hypothetical protein